MDKLDKEVLTLIKDTDGIKEIESGKIRLFKNLTEQTVIHAESYRTIMINIGLIMGAIASAGVALLSSGFVENNMLVLYGIGILMSGTIYAFSRAVVQYDSNSNRLDRMGDVIASLDSIIETFNQYKDGKLDEHSYNQKVRELSHSAGKQTNYELLKEPTGRRDTWVHASALAVGTALLFVGMVSSYV
ncbi:MAG: hypothetical protein AAB573_02175 [Patescibacteria group bacterium]